MKITAFIFDLDGVLVDTAKFHYLAWRRLAGELGFDLTPEWNERLKGVSRMRCLELILAETGRRATAEEMQAMATKKNGWYVEQIARMKPSEVLPNVKAYLRLARAKGLKTAVGSASRNTPAILERTGLAQYFDAVIDGNVATEAKPAPQVFLKGANALRVEPVECVVFEDAASGIEAARRAGMRVVGIGKPSALSGADLVIHGFAGVTPTMIIRQLEPETQAG